MSYIPRIADALLKEELECSSAVLIKGPKWCGKTATAQQQAKSAIYLQDPDRAKDYLYLAETKPSNLLEGEEPRLIDEWEMAPVLWDAVRYAVDRDPKKGRFMLTGSSAPKAKPAHSGVGRIARLEMRTMSLWESGESSGTVSLAKAFDGDQNIRGESEFDLDDYLYAICRGGWPVAVRDSNKKSALRQAQAYVDELLDSNINEMDDKQRNPSVMRAIMRSYARHVSTEANLSTIMADIVGESPSDTTVADYLNALKRAFVIDDLEAWQPRLRSKTAIRTSPTRHFTDPSLAAALLGATPEKLAYDGETAGLLFESLAVHDLRCYADALGGSVYHYRDKTGLEADAVVVLKDGRWGAVEVKLSSRQADEAAKNLLKLSARVDTKVMGEPAFLMVITGGATAVPARDGVIVAPLATLRH